MSDSRTFPPEIAGYRIPQALNTDMYDRGHHIDIASMSDEQLLAELWGAQAAYARAYGKPFRVMQVRQGCDCATAAEWLLERVRRLQAERADRQTRSRR